MAKRFSPKFFFFAPFWSSIIVCLCSCAFTTLDCFAKRIIFRESFRTLFYVLTVIFRWGSGKTRFINVLQPSTDYTLVWTISNLISLKIFLLLLWPNQIFEQNKMRHRCSPNVYLLQHARTGRDVFSRYKPFRTQFFHGQLILVVGAKDSELLCCSRMFGRNTSSMESNLFSSSLSKMVSSSLKSLSLKVATPPTHWYQFPHFACQFCNFHNLIKFPTCNGSFHQFLEMFIFEICLCCNLPFHFSVRIEFLTAKNDV